MSYNLLSYLNLELDLWEVEGENKVLIKEVEHSYTWKEIRTRAYSIAAFFISRDFYQQPICIEAKQQAETLILMLGVIMSGNYYIPLSQELNFEKRKKICKLTGAKLYCTLSDTFWDQEIPIFNYSEELKERSLSDTDITKLKEIAKRLDYNSLLYIVFTSGSTGEPKGIVKTHGSMICFLNAYVKQFGFTKEDVLGNQTPFYFDASSKDIYLMFLLRCKMFLIPQELFVRPVELVENLNREKVTIIQWVPSALSILSRLHVFRKIKPAYLKKVFFVGEVFAVKQLKIWMENLPNTEFINLYGASELAGICTYYKIQNMGGLETIPMGYPLPNSKIYLIADGHLVKEAGIIGEIYIESDALSAGYLKDTKKTDAVFLKQPIPELPESRYYQSGDLAKYNENGALEYVSRKDFQIKHMGHRIELGEIEVAACEINAVANACCVYVKDRIVLFYEGCIQKAEVLTYLKSRLLPYMVPNKVVSIEEMPLSANGKINRLYLKESLM